MGMSSKNNILLVGIVGLVVVIVVVIIAIKESRSPTGPPEDLGGVEEIKTSPVKEIAMVNTPVPTVEPSPTPGLATPTPTPEVVEAESEPTPIDPEHQPRKFFVMEFNNLYELPEGYTLENLQLTERGIELLPPKPGEENTPRYGVLYSPPIEMDFASNAISPLWREELPEGTDIFVEVSVSPDGENWGIWHPITPDADSEIREFYPDGRPNPNYGYTPGGVLCWGLRQWKYFRFKITLYSEVKDSPILSGFRLFYQDSTLGQGYLTKLRDDQ